jgi:hypothetical protein
MLEPSGFSQDIVTSGSDGLGGVKGEETDADGDSDRKKFRYSFLLSCCLMRIPTWSKHDSFSGLQRQLVGLWTTLEHRPFATQEAVLTADQPHSAEEDDADD